MTRPSKPSVFLHRANYRQRRLRDAAKLVPFIGMLLWAIPLAWQGGSGDGSVGAGGLVYIFCVWVFLIIMTAVLSSRVTSDAGADDRDTSDR